MKTILTITDQVKIAANGEEYRGRILGISTETNLAIITKPFQVDVKETPKRGKRRASEDNSEGVEVPHASTVPQDEAGTTTPVWYAFGRGEKVTLENEHFTIEHDTSRGRAE